MRIISHQCDSIRVMKIQSYLDMKMNSCANLLEAASIIDDDGNPFIFQSGCNSYRLA